MSSRQIKNYLYSISDQLANSQTGSDFGLLGGKLGHALFQGHLYLEYGQETHSNRFTQIIEEALDHYTSNDLFFSLSDGVTGLLWALQHFCQLKLIDDGSLEDVQTLETQLIDSFQEDKVRNNYDLLHGMLGKGIYFLEGRPTALNREALYSIVQHLKESAILNKDGITWYDYYTIEKDAPLKFNLGMAHGVPGIIGFLCKVHKQGIAIKECKYLIEQASKWLLSNEKEHAISRYSYYSNELTDSRLAWCYGDLGPALALFHASAALDRKDWYERAVRIAENASKRSLTNSMVAQNDQGDVDHCFCHGTSGIAHIFHRIYQATHLPLMKQTAIRWLQLDKITQPENILAPSSEPQNGQDGSLLQGLSGTALVILASTNPGASYWDSLFLTDIS